MTIMVIKKAAYLVSQTDPEPIADIPTPPFFNHQSSEISIGMLMDPNYSQVCGGHVKAKQHSIKIEQN
jgi:hypothetical protein